VGQIGLMHLQVVERQKWLDEQELIRASTSAMCSPGRGRCSSRSTSAPIRISRAALEGPFVVVLAGGALGLLRAFAW